MYYVYFLRSLKNNKVYTGRIEKQPVIRLNEHNNSSNIWTKQNGPFKLLYFEKYHCLADASEKEMFYKTGFGRKIRDAIIEAVSAKGGPASGGG